MRLGQIGPNVADWDIINLFFPTSRHDREIIWMVSTYVLYVWDTVNIMKKQDVKFDKFFGFLTFKFKMYQATSLGLDQVLVHILNLHYT